MEWFKKSGGSALVVVLGFSTLIGVVTLGWWWRASMQYDIIVTRERFYKNFHAADTVLAHGIRVAKKHFAEFLRMSAAKKFSGIVLDCSKIAKETSDDVMTHGFCMITAVYKNQSTAHCDATRFDATHFDATHCDALRIFATHFDATHFDATHFDATHFDATHFDAAQGTAAQGTAVRGAVPVHNNIRLVCTLVRRQCPALRGPASGCPAPRSSYDDKTGTYFCVENYTIV